MNEPVLVRIEDLVLPEVYVNEVYVERLAVNWDQSAMGPIHARRRRDGRWLVTDGVHRAVAAERSGAESVWVSPHD